MGLRPTRGDESQTEGRGFSPAARRARMRRGFSP